ncbi:SurA N-terminal domain-containing protein [Oceanobacillus salinisoli]|uniref:SurA N-terminal domain-containing protein n=1 Tax=Oceanobacillus salinisoli TaxID=2678611 RepID=UPI0012E23FEA|nr:SurA N-terminal domain-containing protein [Oceanobacillus salinisoli]
MKKSIFYTIMISLVLVLAACNADDGQEDAQETGTDQVQEQEQPEQEPLEITDEERVDEETSVVSVNGQEVEGAKYNQIYTQIKTMMHQYGQDVSDTDLLKEQAISILVEQELINQEAEKKGIEVTEEEANEELETIKAETGDQFATILDQYQMDEEGFKNQLIDDLLTAKYMEQELDVEVTDKEVEEYYNQLKEQNGEIGEFEEVEQDIKSLLQEQKQSEQLQARINELREEAEVETLI